MIPLHCRSRCIQLWSDLRGGFFSIDQRVLQAVALYVDPELSGSVYEQKRASVTGKRARLEQNILRARRRYSPL